MSVECPVSQGPRAHSTLLYSGCRPWAPPGPPPASAHHRHDHDLSRAPAPSPTAARRAPLPQHHQPLLLRLRVLPARVDRRRVRRGAHAASTSRSSTRSPRRSSSRSSRARPTRWCSAGSASRPCAWTSCWPSPSGCACAASATRLDTNGHGQLLNPDVDVPAALAAAGLDAVTVSLNAADPQAYDHICRPLFAKAHRAVIQFAEQCVRHDIETTLTAVDYPGADLRRVRGDRHGSRAPLPRPRLWLRRAGATAPRRGRT